MQICEPQTNFLQNTGYQLVLPRFPHLQYYSTSFVLPDVQLPPAQVATPFTDVPVAGDKPVFAPFTFQFIITDDMKNYEEAFKWITSIGFADSYDTFKNYDNKDKPEQQLGEQDAKVIILSSKNNPTRVITFYDAIPIALSGITPMTSQAGSVQYVSASITMAYSRFAFTD
jgi:hypothetical protein